MAHGRVLIVEDEREVSSVIAAILRREGYDPATASSAESGLKEVDSRPPDLILDDVVLPGMDGFEFLRALRRRSEVPVIFLTGRGHRR